MACWNIRHNDIPSTIPAFTPNPIILRVYWSITTNTQCVRRIADSHRNKSTLHRLSFIWPRNVSQDGPLDLAPVGNEQPESVAPRPCRSQHQTCSAILGRPHVGLRCFIWTTASISSRLGPSGPAFGRPLERRGGGISVSLTPGGSAREWRALARLWHGPNERGGSRACRSRRRVDPILVNVLPAFGND